MPWSHPCHPSLGWKSDGVTISHSSTSPEELPLPRREGWRAILFLIWGRVRWLILHPLHKGKSGRDLHFPGREGHVPWSPPTFLPLGSNIGSQGPHSSTSQRRDPPSKGGTRQSSPRSQYGGEVAHPPPTCHGHLPSFCPVEARWSDNDHTPPLLQKRFAFLEEKGGGRGHSFSKSL